MKKFRSLSLILCLSMLLNLIAVAEPVSVKAVEPKYGVEFNIAIKQLVLPSAEFETEDSYITAIEWTNEDLSTTGICFDQGVSSPFYAKLDGTTVKLYSSANTIELSGDWSGMFCCLLTCRSIDLSRFDTSSVTNMSAMFAGCCALTSLDISSFNTSNVTYMQSMFNGCSALTSLDVSHFDTSNVTDMFAMFCNCQALTSLDLSSFNTSNVPNMNSMFAGCSALTSLDVSHFDTSNVSDMTCMFAGCCALTSLDISSFNTFNVAGMSYMFEDCSALTYMQLPVIPTSLSYYPELPLLDSHTWHLEDGTETTEIKVGDGLKHTYIRDDYVEPPLSNPTSATIALEAEQTGSYEISVPAIINFTQDGVNRILDDEDHEAWVPYLIYNLEQERLVSNYGTYFAEIDLLSHNTLPDDCALLYRIEPPVMRGTTTNNNVNISLFKNVYNSGSTSYPDDPNGLSMSYGVRCALNNISKTHMLASGGFDIYGHGLMGYHKSNDEIRASYSCSAFDYSDELIEALQSDDFDSVAPKAREIYRQIGIFDPALCNEIEAVQGEEAAEAYYVSCNDEYSLLIDEYAFLPGEIYLDSTDRNDGVIASDHGFEWNNYNPIILAGQFDTPDTYTGNLVINFSMVPANSISLTE